MPQAKPSLNGDLAGQTAEENGNLPTSRRSIPSHYPASRKAKVIAKFQPRTPVIIGEAAYTGMMAVEGGLCGQLGVNGGAVDVRQRTRGSYFGSGPELNGELIFKDILRVSCGRTSVLGAAGENGTTVTVSATSPTLIVTSTTTADPAETATSSRTSELSWDQKPGLTATSGRSRSPFSRAQFLKEFAGCCRTKRHWRGLLSSNRFGSRNVRAGNKNNRLSGSRKGSGNFFGSDAAWRHKWAI